MSTRALGRPIRDLQVFATKVHGLRELGRSAASDGVTERVRSIWRIRDDRYSDRPANTPDLPKIEMSSIGVRRSL